MSTPDKCPHCGAGIDVEWPDRDITFECESELRCTSETVSQSLACLERTARKKAENERDEARKERDAAIQLLANWCDAVATDSSFELTCGPLAARQVERLVRFHWLRTNQG